MAITQDRLIALVRAGQQLRDMYLMDAHEVLRLIKQVKLQEITGAEFVQELTRKFADPASAVQAQHALLELEHYKWKITHRDNERNRKRMAEYRAKWGGSTKRDGQLKRQAESEKQYDEETTREIEAARKGIEVVEEFDFDHFEEEVAKMDQELSEHIEKTLSKDSSTERLRMQNENGPRLTSRDYERLDKIEREANEREAREKALRELKGE